MNTKESPSIKTKKNTCFSICLNQKKIRKNAELLIHDLLPALPCQVLFLRGGSDGHFTFGSVAIGEGQRVAIPEARQFGCHQWRWLQWAWKLWSEGVFGMGPGGCGWVNQPRQKKKKYIYIYYVYI